jgi:hemoglobin-like flavoprotein
MLNETEPPPSKSDCNTARLEESTDSRRPPMTPDQITLVQASLPSVLAIREAAAALFYDRLFEIDPTTRPLFSGKDMSQQGTKLMAAIAMVVGSLRRLETIERDIQKLAQRHVAYGVRASHYESVGAALLWTLERGLGSAFTPELKAAWTAAYAILSRAMQGSDTRAMAA